MVVAVGVVVAIVVKLSTSACVIILSRLYFCPLVSLIGSCVYDLSFCSLSICVRLLFSWIPLAKFLNLLVHFFVDTSAETSCKPFVILFTRTMFPFNISYVYARTHSRNHVDDESTMNAYF